MCDLGARAFLKEHCKKEVKSGNDKVDGNVCVCVCVCVCAQ
jgi:hypothetical protein